MSLVFILLFGIISITTSTVCPPRMPIVYRVACSPAYGGDVVLCDTYEEIRGGNKEIPNPVPNGLYLCQSHNGTSASFTQLEFFEWPTRVTYINMVHAYIYNVKYKYKQVIRLPNKC